jgi:hypothetical protein
MKKFALLAMLLCSMFVTVGCGEKKDKKEGDKPAAGAAEKPAGEKPADEKPAEK